MANMTSDGWRAAEACAKEAPLPRAHESGEIAIALRHSVPRVVTEALSQIGVGCAVIDVGTERVILANEGLAALVGRTANDMTGRFFAELVDPDDANVARQHLREGAATGADRAELRSDSATGADRAELRSDSPSEGPLALRLLHAKAKYVTAAIAFRSLGREAGPELVLMVVSKTASESRSRGPFQAALDDAMESIREREDLFALAAHELRGALTSPLLHLQAMARAGGGEPAVTAHGLAIAVGYVKRVTGLVDQLLDIARVRAGRLTLRREIVDLSEIARGVTARFVPECERSETPIEAVCEGPVLGRWDPLRLDQIVTNLVSNALKHGARSPVRVSVHASDTHATLTVIDHGPGIPRRHQERIFERFERANEDASVAGSGLGLWIVRRLAEAHGGTADVFSEPEHGATFVVELPFE